MRIRRGQLAILSLLWAVLAMAASMLWPGPLKLDRQNTFRRAFAQGALPPVAEIAAPSYVSAAGGKGQARIFWQAPQAGRVHISIEVQPKKRRTGPSQSFSHDNRVD